MKLTLRQWAIVEQSLIERQHSLTLELDKLAAEGKLYIPDGMYDAGKETAEYVCIKRNAREVGDILTALQDTEF